jgi:peptidoglycan/LPS O-acetylase OafA/YrhL
MALIPAVFATSFSQSSWVYVVTPIVSTVVVTLTGGRFLLGFLAGGVLPAVLYLVDLATTGRPYYSDALFIQLLGFGTCLGMLVQALRRGERRTVTLIAIALLAVALLLIFRVDWAVSYG